MKVQITNLQPNGISISDHDAASDFIRRIRDTAVNDIATDSSLTMERRSPLRGLVWDGPLDSPQTEGNDKGMTDITRQELDARFKENEAKIVASEAKMDTRFANFDSSIKSGFADLTLAMTKQSAAMEKQTDALRVEMAKQSGDVRTEMSAIRAEMHKGTAELIRWGATIAFAAVASTVGLLTYINKVTEKPASQSTTQTQTAATNTLPTREPTAPATPITPRTQVAPAPGAKSTGS